MRQLRGGRRLILANAGFAFAAGVPSLSSAQLPSYQFNLLPTNGAIASYCNGKSLNNAGQIAGGLVTAAGTMTPAFWSSAVSSPIVMSGLGGKFAIANRLNQNGSMSGMGTVAGDARIYGIYWPSPAATPVMLSPASPQTNSIAEGINDASPPLIGGTSINSFTLTTATVPSILYTPQVATAWAGSSTPTTLAGGVAAWDVNNTPELVGANSTSGVKWTIPLTNTAAPLCGGSIVPPVEVNAGGTTTATLTTGSPAVCAPGAASWTALSGGASTAGTGVGREINSANWIVSAANTTSSLLLWIPSGGTYSAPNDLTSLLPANLSSTGWKFAGGPAINDNNWIAGYITNSASGLSQCYVLSTGALPPPPPSSSGADVPLPPWVMIALTALLAAGIAGASRTRRQRPSQPSRLPARGGADWRRSLASRLGKQ